MKMDRLAALRCFVEVVDRGSLTAAGESLGRSLPTVVRTLANLEASLGVVLLRRTTRRMSLTEEGRIYLERGRRLLAGFSPTFPVYDSVVSHWHTPGAFEMANRTNPFR